MKRREFIGVAAAGAAGLALPVAAGTRERVPVSLLATPHLPGPLQHHEPVGEIGRSYRRAFPTEDSVDALAETMLTELKIDLAATTAAEVSERLQDLVRRDFSDGRTVTLNGWVLSATEARQCALYSLLAL